MPPSTINLWLAAVRRLAYEAADCGLLSPDLAAGIRRVKGAKRLGVRVGMDASSLHSLIGMNTAEEERVRTPKLNDREQAVLQCVFEGLTNKEISTRLDISESYVKGSPPAAIRKKQECAPEASSCAWRLNDTLSDRQNDEWSKKTSVYMIAGDDPIKLSKSPFGCSVALWHVARASSRQAALL